MLRTEGALKVPGGVFDHLQPAGAARNMFPERERFLLSFGGGHVHKNVATNEEERERRYMRCRI